MLELKTAEDVMIPISEYPNIPSWYTIRQAMAELEGKEFNVGGRKSLPRVVLVVDKNGNVKGAVRRRDLMRELEPDFLISKPLKFRKKLFSQKADSDTSDLSYEKMVESVRRQAERPVSDVMLPILRTVSHDENLIRIAYEMVEFNTSLLPVLKNRKTIGVVRSVELFAEISNLVLQI